MFSNDQHDVACASEYLMEWELQHVMKIW